MERWMAGERIEMRDQAAAGRWRHRTLPLGLLLMILAPAPVADAATLTVGTGKQYRTVAGAVAAARDGDVIQVQAGTYTNDFAIVGKKVSIVGVGGMARLVATTAIGNGKAILVTTTDVTLDHVEFAGARVADRNGAGIRYEGGRLTVKKCYFHDNENGILADASATGSISIAGSEFARNGYGDGYTHGVYANRIASLTITNSYFHDTRVGHHIKSRAAKTTVSGSRLVDGTNGTASYSIDLPNGGQSLVSSNIIEQSAASQNPALLHFGGEGTPYPGSSLKVTGNTLQNYRSPAVGLLNHTAITASVTRNKLYQLPNLVSGPSTQANNTTLSSPVAVSTKSPWAR
jgi:hypothetical protein